VLHNLSVTAECLIAILSNIHKKYKHIQNKLLLKHQWCHVDGSQGQDMLLMPRYCHQSAPQYTVSHTATTQNIRNVQKCHTVSNLHLAEYEHATTTTIVLRPFVRDYLGEPVPQETFTRPPSWSSSNLYQLLPSTVIHSILLVQIVWQSFHTTSLHVLFEHCACYYFLYLTKLHKTAMYDLFKMSFCNVMKYLPYPKYCSYILRLTSDEKDRKKFYMNPGNGTIKVHFGSTSFLGQLSQWY